ncbi:MAG: alpha-1,4-glucan--maltose-1-phosphate maltosyltransferase [Chloroflexi bacterium]|nr:MAG: alpha-1,4-glucan--maltose-1-phosphate maltosyltransferase [Chloroflexota bacterium]
MDPRRVVVDRVRPLVDCGLLPAKATAGLPLPISAVLVADGHDPLLGWVWHGPPLPQLRDATALPRGWREVSLDPQGNDRYAGWITPTQVGDWAFAVGGVPDDYGAWLRDLRIRIEAGQDTSLDLEEGAIMAERRHREGVAAADQRALVMLAGQLRAGAAPSARLHQAERPQAVALMRRTADRSRATIAGPFPVWVDRERAGFSAWYEMFPRSEGSRPSRSGTFRTASQRLPAIAAMGFDVVYLPPIHPIGRTHRKGRNNSLECGPDDPGSPWAIGATEGGHTAVHPELGTLDDFELFLSEARSAGLEVALDYALQTSADHPWVHEHPAWFRHRADGSVRYAENPPKRYQDIYPFDFDTDDRDALWAALREVMLFWIARGVRLFRVDNPHTKPLRFWEWLIRDIHARHPDVLFLAEAFTRPAVMQRLAKLGFTQSYTYFTWRNSKWELSEYLHELSQTEEADWFRPNFWVNTPDILHATLQRGGLPAFRLRAVLAAITCPSWGMYSGYELGENIPLREGSEEYLDSEKYQLRPRKWDQPQSLAPFIAKLNAIRNKHREAIAQLSTLRLHHVDNEEMLCVSRAAPDRDDVLLLVLNLDPYATREATTWLDLAALGIPAERPFEAHDELGGATYTWQGPRNYVRLDPAVAPAHVLHLRRP